MVLKVQKLNTYYGAIHALKGIDMEVEKGEIVSLIGSNGAGKTTLLNTVTGVVKPSSGRVFLNDQEITNMPSYNLTKMKASISPEERARQQAGTLSGGEQQMLAVGRALMSSPELLFLDEPSLGLAPNYVAMIFEMIKEINKQGVTILLIEQNANMALMASDRAYVIENGLVTMSGPAKDISKDPRVKKAYLGMS